MWYPHIKNDNYPSEISIKALEKLVKNKSKFNVNQGTVFYKKKYGPQEAFILISQHVETILRYHCDLVHTCSQNLHIFYKTKSGGLPC